ncbi:MAG: hypothetical protein ACTSPB_23945 [Candidatus Thorarchaeota archaeon]
MADMTIEQVKKEKIKLESAIAKLLQDFEKKTTTYLSYINFERKMTDKEKKAEKSGNLAYVERKGAINNVTIEMRIDI